MTTPLKSHDNKISKIVKIKDFMKHRLLQSSMKESLHEVISSIMLILGALVRKTKSRTHSVSCKVLVEVTVFPVLENILS